MTVAQRLKRSKKDASHLLPRRRTLHQYDHSAAFAEIRSRLAVWSETPIGTIPDPDQLAIVSWGIKGLMKYEALIAQSESEEEDDEGEDEELDEGEVDGD